MKTMCTKRWSPQIRKLIKAEVIQPDRFDQQVIEVTHAGKRLVLRCDPSTQRKERHRRKHKLQRLAERNAFVDQSARAKPEAGLQRLQQWASQHKLSAFVELTLNNRTIELQIDEQAKQEATLLDGCSTVPKAMFPRNS